MKDVLYYCLLLFGWVTVESKTFIADELNAFKYIIADHGCYVNHYTIRHDSDPKEHPTNVIPRDSYPALCYHGASHIGMNFGEESGKFLLNVCGFIPENKEFKCQKLDSDGKMSSIFEKTCDGFNVNSDNIVFRLKNYESATTLRYLVIENKNQYCEVRLDNYKVEVDGSGGRIFYYDTINRNVLYDNKDLNKKLFALGNIMFDYFPDHTCQAYALYYGTKNKMHLKTIHLKEEYDYIYEIPEYEEVADQLAIPSLDRPVNKEAKIEKFVTLKYERKEDNHNNMNCNLIIKGLVKSTVTIPVDMHCDNSHLYHGIGYEFNQKNNHWSIWLCLVNEDQKMNCMSYLTQPGNIANGKWHEEINATVKDCEGSEVDTSKLIINNVKSGSKRKLEYTLVTDMKSCAYEMKNKDLSKIRESSGNTWMNDNAYDPVREEPVSPRDFKFRNGENKHMFIDSYGKHYFQHTQTDVVVHYVNGKETKTFADVDAVLEYPTAVRILLNHHSFKKMH